MVLFGRRTVSCFSCGQRSGVRSNTTIQLYQSGAVQYFQCPHCTADNYFNEDGEPADHIPFVPSTPRHAPRYAHPRESPAPFQLSANLQNRSSASQVLCRICQHNQQIVHQKCTDFPIPDESDPNYRLVTEVDYPRYKRDLERRFPPVCENCEPRVNADIQRKNYQAKAGLLGTMFERQRKGELLPKLDTSGGGWGIWLFKWYLWSMRGLLWIYFTALVLAWHFVSVLYAERRDGPEVEWRTCITTIVSNGGVAQEWYDLVQIAVRRTLWASALSFFWVYREPEVERHPDRKLVGGWQYLKTELGANIYRYLSWALLVLGLEHQLPLHTYQIAHVVRLGVMAFVTLFSVSCLKVEQLPRISLREPEPIRGVQHEIQKVIPYVPEQSRPTRQPPYQPVQAPVVRPLPHGTPPPARQALAPPPAFSLNQPRSQAPAGNLARRPSDDDAMDWAPSQPSQTDSLPSAWQARDPNAPQPSPFVGSLPPAPGHSVFASRDPQPDNRPNFFARQEKPTQSPPQGAAFDKHSAFGYKLGDPRFEPLPPARFNPDLDELKRSDQYTGLEGLMGGSLSLNEDLAVQQAVLRAKAAPKEAESWVEPLLRGLLLGVAAALWHTDAAWAGTLAPVGTLALASMWAAYRLRSFSCALALAEIFGCFAVAAGTVGGNILGGLFGLQQEKVALEPFEDVGIGQDAEPSPAEPGTTTTMPWTDKALVGLLASAVLREVWSAFMRMQRDRKRELWTEHGIEALEKKAEERQSTVKLWAPKTTAQAQPSQRVSAAATARRPGGGDMGFGGMGLGSSGPTRTSGTDIFGNPIGTSAVNRNRNPGRGGGGW